MNEVVRQPLVSSVSESLGDVSLAPNSTYLFAYCIEDRSRLQVSWMQRHQETRFVELIVDEADRSSFGWGQPGSEARVRLRSDSELRAFVHAIARTVIYLDITGLPHFLWMPLVRALLREEADVRVLYSEPGEYMPGIGAPGAELYELSERVSSAEPIPGFASLERDTERPLLVALLGFEGGRFARVKERVQADPSHTFPIIGVPGFELHYPFITYYANREGLLGSLALANVAFAQANCPFALLYALEDLERRLFPVRGIIKVAPIGTKPHSLGALLYYLRSSRSVEIVYDHPVRSAGRTKGVGRCWTYPLGLLDFRPDRLTA